MSASLQSLTGKNLISRGLRLAVVGIELGIGSHWQHLGHRKSGGLPLGTKVRFNMTKSCDCAMVFFLIKIIGLLQHKPQTSYKNGYFADVLNMAA